MVRRFLLALGLFSGAFSTLAQSAELEMRYVTSWSPEVLVRVTHPDAIEANWVRYRLAESPKTGPWTDCRLVSLGRLLPHRGRSWDDKRASWQTPVKNLTPGDYKVVFDVRTPQEAYFIDSELKVPQIARYSGETLTPDTARKAFPQNRFSTLPQDGTDFWLAWDRQALHVLPLVESRTTFDLTLDLLPVTPGKATQVVHVNGFTTVPWSTLSPAGPHLGEVLRASYQDSSGKTQEHDVLLTGSGSGMYFGANIVTGVSDDQGPPREQLESLYRLGGLTEKHVGVGLYEFYPDAPPQGEPVFDFTALKRNPGSYWDGLVICGVDGFVEWMRDKEYDPAIWPVPEKYAEEAARAAASLGIHTYSMGYNEPELFYRSDNKTFFVDNLNHIASAVRRGDPKARIIAGKFSAGDPELIKGFAAAGFRDNFDILDIHPYSNDPRTGQDMGGVVASHEALAEIGMGHKQIYLGEGWGPTRNLHQWPRADHDAPVDQQEADFMRQYYWNGYRCLATPRDDYNPEWVIGAHFFTLNDNMGMTYWKHNAIPHYNEMGEIDYYLLSHLRFGDLSDVKPIFFNGGLVDFYGRPKGDWFFDFPPALPQIRVQTLPEFKYMLPNQPETLHIRVINADSRPFTDLSIGLRSRTYKWSGQLLASTVESVTRATLAPGEAWTFTAEVTAANALPGPLRIAVEVDYRCEKVLYVGDEIVRTEVRGPLAAVFKPQRVVLSDLNKEAPVAVTMQNNTVFDLGVPILEQDGPVRARVESKEIQLKTGESKTFTINVSAPDARPGISDVRFGWDIYEALSVIRPLDCPRAAKPPVIDGDIADWPKIDTHSSITFPKAAQMMARPSWIPFPEPPPASGSAFETKSETSPGAVSNATISQPKTTTFGAEGSLLWDDRALYLALWVEDSSHVQNEFGMEMWRGDSVQIAIDPKGDGAGERTISPGRFLKHATEENYSPDDFEITVGLTRKGTQIAANVVPPGMKVGTFEGAQAVVRHDTAGTTYEIALPWTVLRTAPPKADTPFALDILVNNFDGADRATLGMADAIGNGKYPSRFIPVRFKD